MNRFRRFLLPLLAIAIVGAATGSLALSGPPEAGRHMGVETHGRQKSVRRGCCTGSDTTIGSSR